MAIQPFDATEGLDGGEGPPQGLLLKQHDAGSALELICRQSGNDFPEPAVGRVWLAPVTKSPLATGE